MDRRSEEGIIRKNRGRAVLLARAHELARISPSGQIRRTLARRRNVGIVGCLFRRENAEVNFPAVLANARLPLAGSSVKTSPL
jgi:hypothetical protein